MSAWWEAGVRFACTGCGSCCTGAGGTVRVSPEEAERLARRLDLAPEAFAAIHLRRLEDVEDGAMSLRERPNGDCVFLAAEPDAEGRRGCAVYSDRPRQCRTWPFWRAALASPEHWRRAGERCPGIGRGPVHAAEEVRAALADDGTSGRVPPLG